MRRSWTKRTTIAPSPTAVAHRLTEPGPHVAGCEDTRDARLEQAVGPGGGAGENEPVVVTRDHVAEPLGARRRAEEEEEEREREPLAVLQGDRFQLAVSAVERRDLAAIADGDAVALELEHEVVGHRLAQVSAAMKQRHERAAARQPDGGLPGRVAAADHADPGGAAALGLGRAGRVEDADSLVRLEVVDRQPAVVGAGGEDDRAGRDLVVVLETDDVPVGARLERHRAVRRRRTRAELSRLRDRAGRQLRAADSRREAEVVLDPARGASLAAEGRALDDQGLEALRRAVDRRAEARRAAADHNEVDLLARRKLEADPERARHLARRRGSQLGAAREDARVATRPASSASTRAATVASSECSGSRQVCGRRLRRANSTIRRVGSDDRGPRISTPIPSSCCSASRRAVNVGEQQVGERRVVEEQRAEDIAIDRDVAHRLRDDRRQVDGLAREQIDLAEEAGRPVPDDLVPVPVEDRRLALEDRDERVAQIANPIEDVADRGRALLTDVGERLELRSRQRRSRRRIRHPGSVPPTHRPTPSGRENARGPRSAERPCTACRSQAQGQASDTSREVSDAQ